MGLMRPSSQKENEEKSLDKSLCLVPVAMNEGQASALWFLGYGDAGSFMGMGMVCGSMLAHMSFFYS